MAALAVAAASPAVAVHGAATPEVGGLLAAAAAAGSVVPLRLLLAVAVVGDAVAVECGAVAAAAAVAGEAVAVECAVLTPPDGVMHTDTGYT